MLECAAKLDWPASTSVMVSAPLVVRLPETTATSSVTEPVETPPITGTSLVPWMGSVARCETGLAGIDVGDGERAAGGEVAGNNRDILGHRTGGNAADHRHVVGAVDGDGDDLAGGGVAGDGGEAIGDRLGGAELLDRAQAVVDGVGPVAGGIEREGALGPGDAGVRGEIGLAGIDVGDGERAAGGEVAGNNRDILGHRTGGNAADHRHVVGAVDGDGDDLAGGG